MKPDIMWTMGQSLYPAHFQHMQETLCLKSFTLANSFGTPGFGIVEFAFDDAFLKIGIIRIIKLTLIAVDGQVIELGTNADCNDFDLNEMKENKIDVIINASKKEIVYKFEDTNLRCVGYDIKLANDTLASYDYNIKLMELKKDLNKQWSIEENFIPATTNINLSLCKNLKKLVISTCQKVYSSYNSMTKQKEFYVKATEYKPSVAVAESILFKMKNAEAGYYTHPLYYYDQLYLLYVNIALFLNAEPGEIQPYNHSNIYILFFNLIEKINDLISLENKSVKFVKFEKIENFMRLDTLEDSILNSNNLYFVVQKKYDNQPFTIEGLKIASPSRFPILDQLAISGIMKEKVEEVPFRHYLSGSSIFYQLKLGKEWDYVIKDRAVVFKFLDEYNDIQFYLYYF